MIMSERRPTIWTRTRPVAHVLCPDCSRVTRKPDRAWYQQWHDQPVAVEATGDEAKSEAQCEGPCREIGAAVTRPRSREIRCPQQPFLSRCSARLPARD